MGEKKAWQNKTKKKQKLATEEWKKKDINIS